MSEVRWQRVNDDGFEYAIKQGPHGDEFVVMGGLCLRRAPVAEMTAEIVTLADRRLIVGGNPNAEPVNPGNGAREALIDFCVFAGDPAEMADDMLAQLWLRGFKVVPVDPGDAA